MAAANAITRKAQADTASGRLAKAVGIAVGVIIFAILIMALFLAKGFKRLGSVEGTAEKARAQSAANGDVLAQIKALADTQTTTLNATNAAAMDAKRGADEAARSAAAAEAASKFLASCFGPDGPCTKASAQNQAFIRDRLTEVIAKVTGTEFVVREVVGAKPGQPKFVATPVASPAPPAPCRPTVQLGDQGIAPGILSTCPSP